MLRSEQTKSFLPDSDLVVITNQADGIDVPRVTADTIDKYLDNVQTVHLSQASHFGYIVP